MLALDLTDGAGLALEARADLVRRERGAQELDRDLTLQLEMARRHHDTGAAFAHEPVEAVLLGEDVADVERYAAERAHAVRFAVYQGRGQRPLKTGFRFSANAASASRRSSLTRTLS